MSSNLLSRAGWSGSAQESATLLQASVDEAVSSVKNHLTDLSFVAGLCVGITVNHFVREAGVTRAKALAAEAEELRNLGATTLGRAIPPGHVPARVYHLPGGLKKVFDVQDFLHMSRLVRGWSYALGMASGSAAYEITNRSFQTLARNPEHNPNLWRWNGVGGLKRGLLYSLFTVGPALGVQAEGAALGFKLSAGSTPALKVLTPAIFAAFGLFGTYRALDSVNQRLELIPR